LSLYLLGVLLAEMPPEDPATEEARLTWSRLIQDAVDPSQPVALREAAARSIAAAGVLSCPELEAAAASSEDATTEAVTLAAWASTVALLQDDDEAVRWSAAMVVSGRPGAGSYRVNKAGPTNSAGRTKDFSPFLVVKAYAQAHGAMTQALWRRPAYTAWLGSSLVEHSVDALALAVEADPAVTRRVFEKERENTHKEDLLCVQAAARELLAVVEREAEQEAGSPLRVEAAAAAERAVRAGVVLLERYYARDGPGKRVVDRLSAGDVTYRASRVAFLAVYALMLYAQATGLNKTNPRLMAELASFDPNVHPALGDLSRALTAVESSGGDGEFEPNFLLLPQQ